MRATMLISLFFLLIITGCTNQGTQKIAGEVIIQYPNKQHFYRTYDIFLQSNFPDVNVTVEVPSDNESYADILYVPEAQVLHQLASEGKLVPLDSYVQEDSFDLEQLSPVVVQTLRGQDGLLYGLAPSFENAALYYNVDLFNEFGVATPENGMTWSEVIELAAQFPNVDREGNTLYGFKTNYYREIPFSLILRIGQSDGLQFIDPSSLKVYMDGGEWETIWTVVIEALKSNSIIEVEQHIQEGMAADEFDILNGNVAMQISSQNMAYNFSNYREYVGGNDVNWGIVSAPVSAIDRNKSDHYQVFGIFAVNTLSANPGLAWSIIKEIHGEKFELSAFDGIATRYSKIKDVDGRDLSPLYTLEKSDFYNDPYELINYELINAFKEVGQELVDKVIRGELDIKEAISRLNSNGQLAIDAMQAELLVE